MSSEREERITERGLVSVIVPVWNTEPYLERCLSSIREQTYPSLEILCIDGGSVDGSVPVIEAAQKDDPRIVLEQADCAGAGEARNIGLNMAKGQYIAFVDSDDYLEEDMVERLVAEMETHQPDLVCFPCCRCDKSGAKQLNGEYDLTGWLARKYPEFSGKNMPKRLFQLTSFHVFSRFYRADFLSRNHLEFSDDFCYDDVSFAMITLAAAEKITCLFRPLYWHRARTTARTMQRADHAEDLFAAWERVRQWLKDRGLLDRYRISYCDCVLRELHRLVRSGIGRETRGRLLSYLEEERCSEVLAYLRAPESISNDSYRRQAAQLLGALEEMKERRRRNREPERPPFAPERPDDPAVTVIMPVYQAEEYLEEALDSILSQSFRDLELLCVDDGSEDRSLEILRRYADSDPRMTVIPLPHCGVGTARNTGIDLARGKYLYFMDSDDILKPGALEIMVRTAEERQLDVLYFDADLFYDEGCSETERQFQPAYRRLFPYPELTDGKDMFARFQSNGEFVVVIWMTLYRRSLVQSHDIRFYPFIVHSDNLFTFETMVNAERAGYLGESLYRRRIRPNSIMTSKRSFLSAWSYFVISEEMSRFYYRERETLTPDVSSATMRRARFMLQGARNEYRDLDDFEQGRAMALDDTYALFKVQVMDAADFARNKKALSEKNKEQKLQADDERKRAARQISALREDLLTMKEENARLETALRQAREEAAKADKEQKELAERLRLIERSPMGRLAGRWSR